MSRKKKTKGKFCFNIPFFIFFIHVLNIKNKKNMTEDKKNMIFVTCRISNSSRNIIL